MRVCAEPGCGDLTRTRWCDAHARAHERARGTRQQRGYDQEYDRQRARWAGILKSRGWVHCHAPECIETSRVIVGDQAWDLGHDDARKIRGPEHASCNRSAGGKARHGQ